MEWGRGGYLLFSSLFLGFRIQGSVCTGMICMRDDVWRRRDEIVTSVQGESRDWRWEEGI